MRIFRTRYRIVIDNYAGFEVQFRCWWMPFYIMAGFNTFPSVREAERYINNLQKPKVVKYYD